MSPAVFSLCALGAAIAISFSSRLNVGLVAIPLAWAVGYAAGWTPDAVVSGFPASLFITLAGVTLLFSLSEVNGTIERLAHRLLRAAGGSARVLPVLVFLIAGAIATLGPGAIASVALVAPLAMALGARAAVPPFLTALMVANGANAGNLSPFSSVGVIANERMRDAGLGGHELKVFLANFLAHVLVAAIAYVMLARRIDATRAAGDPAAPEAMSRKHAVTLAVVAAWIAAVVFADAPLGLAAFAAAALLIVSRAAPESAALQRMPWGAIVMVCGMTLLVTAAEKARGLQLFTSLLAQLATPHTINGVIAFVTGVISTASSTSGVVLPTFLPMAPGLAAQVGGADPLAVALSINVGSSVVDVSPLSTLGALCVTAVLDPGASRDLFRRLMVWGLSMTIVGALICQLFAGAFARW